MSAGMIISGSDEAGSPMRGAWLDCMAWRHTSDKRCNPPHKTRSLCSALPLFPPSSPHQVFASPNHMLPQVAQLFQPHGFNKEVDGAVGDASQDRVRLAV